MSRIKILHIEDEEIYQRLVRDMLEEQGYEIASAGTGAEGLLRLEQIKPDLVILDINLPDADGYEICRHLRQEERWTKLPILMATVRRHPEEWRKGFSVGASDYVAKPLHAPELLERVQACLEGKTAQQDGPANPEVLMIRATLIGNRGAFDVFVRQYRDRLLQDIVAHARNATEAEDVVSSGLMNAFERLKQFRGQSSVYTWLYRICLYELHHKWRHQHTVPLDQLRDKDQAAIEHSRESRRPSALELSESAKVELLGKAIVQVPEPYRKMLRWHFLQGLPYAVIAERLAWPIGTVKTRLFKAQYMLRDAWRAVHSRRPA